jgi:hypothetical protein
MMDHSKGEPMTLIQKNISNVPYYTDGKNYYTFHVVNSKSDALWIFACMDLGITKRSGFTTEESAKINDLAGIGLQQKTKYLLLKNGQAVQMPYNFTVPDIHPGDIILRHVSPPAVGLVKCPHCASSVLPGSVCSACGKPLIP